MISDKNYLHYLLSDYIPHYVGVSTMFWMLCHSAFIRIISIRRLIDIVLLPSEISSFVSFLVLLSYFVTSFHWVQGNTNGLRIELTFIILQNSRTRALIHYSEGLNNGSNSEFLVGYANCYTPDEGPRT